MMSVELDFFCTCDTFVQLEGGVHLLAAERHWRGGGSSLLLFPDLPPSLLCAVQVSLSSSASHPSTDKFSHLFILLQIICTKMLLLAVLKSLCLTVCSRVSTWLSCSSHTPDSIWTLLTTLWSRSSLQGRWKVRGQKRIQTVQTDKQGFPYRILSLLSQK